MLVLSLSFESLLIAVKFIKILNLFDRAFTFLICDLLVYVTKPLQRVNVGLVAFVEIDLDSVNFNVFEVF